MKHFIIILLSLYSLVAFSQRIKGKVTDGVNGLPSVNVILLDSDSLFIKGITTDATGRFEFNIMQPGIYSIVSSMIGYEKSMSGRFEVVTRDIVLRDLVMVESSTELGEVVISGQKNIVDYSQGNLVINLAGNVTSAGNSLIEVIQKLPGVIIDRQTGAISMNGRPSVRLMINGKLVQAPPDVVVQMLDGVNASNIDKIELLASPPAGMDADGSGGIIHIITKTDIALGTSGSVALTAGARAAEGLGANVTINHRARGKAFFIDYSFVRNHNFHTMESSRIVRTDTSYETVRDLSDRWSITNQHNLNAGLELQLNDKIKLNILTSAYRRNWMLDAGGFGEHFVKPGPPVTTKMDLTEINIWQSAAGSVGLTVAIDPKNELKTSFDYLYFGNSNPSHYNIRTGDRYYNVTATSEVDLTKSTPINMMVGRIDYAFRPTKCFTLEMGLKGVQSVLTNNVGVNRRVGEEWINDPFFSSYSDIHEQIGAGYVSTAFRASKKLKINGGLRYEYTHTRIGTKQDPDLVERKYGYFFPNLLIERQLGAEENFHVSYSRRIARPTFNDIAPYVFLWGTATFSGGNTQLYPSVSSVFVAGYSLQNWSVNAQYSHSLKEIVSWQPERDKLTGNLTYRARNIDHLNTASVTNVYSFNVGSRWTTQNTLTLQRLDVGIDGVTVHRYGVNVNLLHQFKLPHDLVFEISGMFQSRLLVGATYTLPFGSLNAGIQKKFGSTSTLRLAIDDALRTNNWRIRSEFPANDFTASFNYNWFNRFVRVTYTYNFGNRNTGGLHLRSASEEERKRVN